MSFNLPPARSRVFSIFLNAWRVWASKFPASEAPMSSTNPTWPANHIVLPPSVMTAGEKEYLPSQVGSRIVFFNGMLISFDGFESAEFTLGSDWLRSIPNSPPQMRRGGAKRPRQMPHKPDRAQPVMNGGADQTIH